jgi:hypothetical protein
MQAMFDDIWEEMHHQEIQRKACKMMTDGNDLGCLSWLIVCEHLHGIRLVDIVSNVNRRTSLLQDSAHVEKILDRLQKDRLISKVRYGQEDWYYPKRRHGVGRTLDSLTRMVLRGMT